MVRSLNIALNPIVNSLSEIEKILSETLSAKVHLQVVEERSMKRSVRSSQRDNLSIIFTGLSSVQVRLELLKISPIVDAFILSSLLANPEIIVGDDDTDANNFVFVRGYCHQSVIIEAYLSVKPQSEAKLVVNHAE